MNNGIIICGVFLGFETTPKKDGTGTKTSVCIAAGMESFRITLKDDNQISKAYQQEQFKPVAVKARSFCMNNRIFWTDGEFVEVA